MVGKKKIGGNAQKRKRNAIFQHGSIPLTINWELQARYLKSSILPASRGVTSLSEELSSVPDKKFLEDKLIVSFGGTFGVNFIEEPGAIYEAAVVK